MGAGPGIAVGGAIGAVGGGTFGCVIARTAGWGLVEGEYVLSPTVELLAGGSIGGVVGGVTGIATGAALGSVFDDRTEL